MKIQYCLNQGESRAGAPPPHLFEFFVHFDCRTRIYIHGSLHTMFYHRPPNEFQSINSLKVMITPLMNNLLIEIQRPVVLQH